MISSHRAITAIFLALITASFCFYLLWQLSQPKHFQLDISNESTVPVQFIEVFGEGVYQSQRLLNVLPEQITSIRVALKKSGDLRFRVVQEGSAIDYIIYRDVEKLTLTSELQRWLTIYSNQRYLLNSLDEH